MFAKRKDRQSKKESRNTRSGTLFTLNPLQSYAFSPFKQSIFTYFFIKRASKQGFFRHFFNH